MRRLLDFSLGTHSLSLLVKRKPGICVYLTLHREYSLFYLIWIGKFSGGKNLVAMLFDVGLQITCMQVLLSEELMSNLLCSQNVMNQ